MRKQAEMSIEQLENGQYVEHIAYPYVEYDHVTFENGMQIEKALEDDVAMPTVIHDTSSFKVGQGDSDVSDSIVDSSIASMTIKGQTYQNILPSPSLRNSMTDGTEMQKINEGYDNVEVVDGEFKSAILKGQTLVNLFDKKLYEKTELINFLKEIDLVISSDDTITIKCDVSEEALSNSEHVVAVAYYSSEGVRTNIVTKSGLSNINTLNNTTVKIPTSAVRVTLRTYNVDLINQKFMILKGDHTNVDISYFEGMSSVKMPVLKTSNGIVIFDENCKLEDFEYAQATIKDECIYIPHSSTAYIKTKKEYTILPNEAITVRIVGSSKYNNAIYNLRLSVGDKLLTQVSEAELIKELNKNEYYDLIYKNTTNSPISGIIKIWNYFGSYTISHVYVGGMVYKSTILTTPQDLVLRGIGDVKDTLDLITGELVQRIDENGEVLQTPITKTIPLTIVDQDNQPVTQLQSFANGHIQVSSQGLIPSVDYEVPTSNSYHVDLMKVNTQYTMKNMQGTFTIDDIQYNASANGTFTSPSTLTNKFMVTSVAQTNAMLLEGDMTSEEVPYVEGIKSTFDGVDKVEIVSQNAGNTLSNTTSFPITNPLRSLPNGVRDEIVLDRMSNKAKLIQRVGEDLTQLSSPIITQVDIEGFPYVYKNGHIFLNTEVAPTTEVKYSINQSQIIESQSEDIVRHSKEIDNLYNLIATYVQVNYDSTLLNLKTKGV